MAGMRVACYNGQRRHQQGPTQEGRSMASSSAKQPRNGNRLDETTALLQQAMASLIQNQVLFTGRMDAMNDRIDRKFAQIDRRFVEIDHRLDNIESFLQKMFAELPAKVFGFG
jgi:hypothetical protein